MRTDWNSVLADYRGVLGWDAWMDAAGTHRPAVEVPLYIKEMSAPIRKVKPTEVSTIERRYGIRQLRTNMLFFGAPDILQMTISGWMITPVSNKQWVPVDKAGNPLNLGNLSYADIVTAHIEGRMDTGSGRVSKRKDPDYFITPHGKHYKWPIIATWEPTYTTVQKKTPFSMTLYLES